MTDATVAVNFTASVGDLISGVSEAKDALAGFAAPFDATEQPIYGAKRLHRQGFRPYAFEVLRFRASGVGSA